MQSPIEARELAGLPRELRSAFLPLDKRAFGLAIGVTTGLALFLGTLYHLVFDPILLDRVPYLAGRTYSGDSLWLLAAYFRGYDPTTLTGAAIGGLWGLWTGFVTGWFLAFARNLFVAIWLFSVRTREQLAANREFLDQI